MSQLPQYYEYLARNGERSDTHPFKYIEEEANFNIGSLAIPVLEFDPYTFNPFDFGIDYEGIPVEEMPDHPALLTSMSRIIGGPKLHDWVKTNQVAVSETYLVMTSVYKKFVPKLTKKLSKRSTSLWGFNSGLTRAGDIHLQVMGDCACSGPDPDGDVIDGLNEAGYSAYYLHNTDTQAQRTSLYAGLGHLARLASDSPYSP